MNKRHTTMLLLGASFVAGAFVFSQRSKPSTAHLFSEASDRALEKQVRQTNINIEAPSLAATAPVSVSQCEAENNKPLAPSITEPINFRIRELWDRFRSNARAQKKSQRTQALVKLFRQGATQASEATALDDLDRAEDRMVGGASADGGFDTAVVARMALAARHTRTDPKLAKQYLNEAIKVNPKDGYPHAMLASQAMKSRNYDVVQEELRMALRLSPEPAFAYALASTSKRLGFPVEAVRALGVYLQEYPDDKYAVALLARMERRARVERQLSKNYARGVSLHSDLDRTQQRRVQDLVLTSLEGAAQLLGSTRRKHLSVVVYPNDEAMRECICAPSWTGALYDGVLHLNAKRMSDETIKHETLHAQLDALSARAPLWFHEGLAQHFSGVRRDSRGVRKSFSFMQRNKTYIPFSSLEGAFTAIDDSSDAQLAYHQSLALVSILIEDHGMQSLQSAVQGFNKGIEGDELLESQNIDGPRLLQWLAQ